VKIEIRIHSDIIPSISITDTYSQPTNFIYHTHHAVLVEYDEFIPRITSPEYLKFFRKAMRLKFETDEKRRHLHKQYWASP
jgi:hypothetical protein